MGRWVVLDQKKDSKDLNPKPLTNAPQTLNSTNTPKTLKFIFNYNAHKTLKSEGGRWFSKILHNIWGWYVKILTIPYRGGWSGKGQKHPHVI
jgi:hypothetical protein